MKHQLLLFSCLLALPCDGQICNFRGKFIATTGGPTTSIFGLNSTIEHDGSQLIIDSESMVIEDINATTFENQKEMRMQLQCAFSPATDFRESISGEILTFSLDAPQNGNSISKLAHIHFQDYVRRFTFVLFARSIFLPQCTVSDVPTETNSLLIIYPVSMLIVLM